MRRAGAQSQESNTKGPRLEKVAELSLLCFALERSTVERRVHLRPLHAVAAGDDAPHAPGQRFVEAVSADVSNP